MNENKQIKVLDMHSFNSKLSSPDQMGTNGGGNKRKSEDNGELDPRVHGDEDEAMNIDQIEALVGEWVREVQECGIEKEDRWEVLDVTGE